MALTFINGEVTTDGTVQTLFDITTDNNFSTYVFVDTLTATETLEIIVSVLDSQDATMRVYKTYTLTGVQSDPAKFIPFLPTKEYKVTIQLTAGTNRTISWQRIEA